MTFTELKDEYQRLWDSMTIRADKAAAVERIARKLLRNKARYQAAQEATGVPWFVIAALHNRESDADFDTQLAQGDPLSSVSRHEPRGRGPFTNWEEGATDALVTLKGLDRIKDWGPARACYEIERYNGFGYRSYHPSVKSPYLWSFSNHYSAGKYIADGQFSPSAVDSQCGAIPIVKMLMQLDLTARFKSAPIIPPIVKKVETGAAGSIIVAGGAAAAAQTDPKIAFLILIVAVVVAIGAFLLIRKFRSKP